MEKARADIAAAEARTADYEQRLREARQKIFKNQEARRQQANQARSQAVNQARSRAQDQVKQAQGRHGSRISNRPCRSCNPRPDVWLAEIVRTVLAADGVSKSGRWTMNTKCWRIPDICALLFLCCVWRAPDRAHAEETTSQPDQSPERAKIKARRSQGTGKPLVPAIARAESSAMLGGELAEETAGVEPAKKKEENSNLKHASWCVGSRSRPASACMGAHLLALCLNFAVIVGC